MPRKTSAAPATVLLHGAHLLLEAQLVVSMRLLGMVGLWPVRADETARMISEKGPALLRAAAQAQAAALAGQDVNRITLAALTPLTQKARRNRVRLTKRLVRKA